LFVYQLNICSAPNGNSATGRGPSWIVFSTHEEMFYGLFELNSFCRYIFYVLHPTQSRVARHLIKCGIFQNKNSEEEKSHCDSKIAFGFPNALCFDYYYYYYYITIYILLINVPEIYFYFVYSTFNLDPYKKRKFGQQISEC
jgi:hypothetical protein